MHDNKRLTRRKVLGTAIGTGAAGVTGLPSSSSGFASNTARALDLDDPRQRAEARAKVIGSVAPQLVYTFYRLHIYGYMHDGNLVPFFTMNNLNIARWSKQENGNFSSVIGECGVYCRFDTDEVLDVWENPITGEKRKVWDFLSGPITVEWGPDGVFTGGAAELSPEVMRMEVMGDKLFVPTAAHMSVPNPFPPETWPKSSTETTRYWDSLMVAAAPVDEITDPNTPMANAFLQFQNLGSWHPWLGLGGHAGRTYGRAYGSKFSSLDALPTGVLKGIEARTPDVFDFESWDEPRIEFLEYMEANEPS